MASHCNLKPWVLAVPLGRSDTDTDEGPGVKVSEDAEYACNSNEGGGRREGAAPLGGQVGDRVFRVQVFKGFLGF